MKITIYILAVMAALLSGCESGETVSSAPAYVPDSVCYTRYIGYYDVTRGSYTSKYDEFVSKTCIRYSDSAKTECDMLDTLMRITTNECIDTKDIDSSCSIYYYFRSGAPNGPGGLYIDYGGTGDMEQIITEYQKEHMDKVFDHISKECY